MGNVCIVISDPHEHSKPESSDPDDTSTSLTRSRRSSHRGLSFRKRLINLSCKRLVSMKETRYATQAGSLDSPVWQRSILMGERCEPPAFSGLILYDEHGNSVQDFPCKYPKSPVHPALALVV